MDVILMIPVAAAATGSGIDWGTIFTAVGVVFGLVGSAGATWGVLRGSALEASNDRLRKENEDYVRRLDWIEPRFETLSREVEQLKDQYNYGPTLEKLAEQMVTLVTQEKDNHAEVMSAFARLPRGSS